MILECKGKFVGEYLVLEGQAHAEFPEEVGSFNEKVSALVGEAAAAIFLNREAGSASFTVTLRPKPAKEPEASGSGHPPTEQAVSEAPVRKKKK